MPADSYFLDTNVLVYANDRTDARKQQVAAHLITDGIRSGRAVVSSQVLSEFWVTITQKIQVPLDRDTAEKELERFRALRIMAIQYETVRAAVSLQARHQLSYWDALILAAARLAGCDRIYTEDMDADHIYDGVTVRNPFLAAGRS